MQIDLVFSLPSSLLRIGIVEARDIKVRPSSLSYQQEIHNDLEPMLIPDFIYPDHLQKGIRSLLKTFGFHPSGRSRPSSEYLFKDLDNRGEFNFINNIVDINNHLSLLSHLPVSVFDLDKSGYNMTLRVGLEGEQYIFNHEGQSLSLKKLLIVAEKESNIAFGSPVKDSQGTKVFEETRNIAFIIYTSSNITPEDELQQLLNKFSELIIQEALAHSVDTAILNANL